MMKRLMVTLMAASITGGAAAAQENRIDLIRPDAPELAAHGDLAIGVRTVDLANPGQIDIVNVVAGEDLPRYDRPLTVEIWYPADTAEEGGTYEGVYLRDGQTQVRLHGRAVRDAEPADAENDPYPLVIISHGYPGNRFLLGHLAENLATKGYVVVSIDHTDSTYDDQGAFGSTLVNRPLDQAFVLQEMDRMGEDEDGFLAGLVDADNSAVIGYSMGGYGAIIGAGGGVTEDSTEFVWGAPEGTLGIHLAGSETHGDLLDDRVKAVVAIGPWGMNTGFWNEDGLAGIEKPVFYIGGSVDDVSLYEDGIAAIYEQSVNAAERYLLTFESANHNAGAPMPAPVEAWEISESLGYAPFDHYADPVWDTVRMNNITQHFLTAFLGKHLKEGGEMAAYLDLVENAGDGVYSMGEDGEPDQDHNYWKGFAERTAKGLSLKRGAAGE